VKNLLINIPGQKMKNIKINLLILMAFSITSCQLDIPIREMVSAKSAIRQAYEVRADKYDKDNLNKSEDLLYKSQRLCKEEDVKGAKVEAINSLNSANDAIKTSLPLLAADTLKEARKAYIEAEKLNAEKFAAEDYKRAGELLVNSEKLNIAAKYRESCLKAKEALAAALAARNQSLARVPALNEEISQIKKEIEDLRQKEIGEDLLIKVTEAEKSIETAEGDISNNDLKNAEINIDHAAATVAALKLLAQREKIKSKIIIIREDTIALKNSRGNEFAAEEIEVITATLNDAKEVLKGENLDPAAAKISEAESLLKIATEKTNRGIAQEKIESVEKLMKEVQDKDKKKLFKGDIDKSSAIITESREMLDKNSFDDSIQKSIEAETLLHSIGIAIEKEYAKEMARVSHDIKGERIYVVKYYRKDKDCLWRIAQKVYSDARQWPRIYMANRDKIKDPDLIFPGQKFIIPPLTTEKKEEKKSEKNDADLKAITDTGKSGEKEIPVEDKIDTESEVKE